MHKHVTSCSDVYKTLREELLSLTLKEILYKPTKRAGLMKLIGTDDDGEKWNAEKEFRETMSNMSKQEIIEALILYFQTPYKGE